MSESAVSSSATAASPATTAHGGRGSDSSRGRGRGGHGSARGGRGEARGRGTGRGGGRGRGRGSPRGRGGPRKPFVPRERLPQEPRNPIPTDNGRVDDLTVDHEPTNQTLVNQAKDVKQSSRKQTSAFYDLCKSLQSVESLREYVRENHTTLLRQHKEMNSFLQALSNRTVDIYENFFDNSKAEVLVLLERIVELASTMKKQSNAKNNNSKDGNGIYPAALHELCLRAEYYGVKKTAWGEAAAQCELLPGATSATLLTAKEMLAKIAELDPQGRMIRRIEMLTDIPSLMRTIKEFRSSFLAAKASSPEVDVFVALGRLLSKCRRLFEIVVREHPDSKAQGLESDEAEQPKVLPAQLRSEIAEALKELLSLYETVTSNASHTMNPPVVKMKVLISWAQKWGLEGVGEGSSGFEEAREKLSNDAEESMMSAARSLECVMKLKSLSLASAEGVDTASSQLTAILNDEMVEQHADSGNEVLKLYSPDVLSALATATSAVKDNALKERVMRLLVATQRHVLGSTVSLPRRALHFVAAERNRLKQEKRAEELRSKRDRSDDDEDDANNIDS